MAAGCFDTANRRRTEDKTYVQA